VGCVGFSGFVCEVRVAFALVAFPLVVEGSSRDLGGGIDFTNRRLLPMFSDVRPSQLENVSCRLHVGTRCSRLKYVCEITDCDRMPGSAAYLAGHSSVLLRQKRTSSHSRRRQGSLHLGQGQRDPRGVGLRGLDLSRSRGACDLPEPQASDRPYWTIALFSCSRLRRGAERLERSRQATWELL
jgi:hypothetical protein